ncbi:hypothetical protein GIB67_005300 [Kingdonia uniflora]|uniref:E3 ubiquitin protein ligase n=1 Tax=Kingdonia uniflora TaxID=39325 RepID=A0A7J7LCM7_9MAGN|nr:hypothetical protein GIB67_005300 [Kingdonia uniflora]
MGSTEPDRKRRHFSSISSPTAAAAKKHPALPVSEEKKLDAAVLQYQNKKLVQQLDVQKAEYSTLETKFSSLKGNQQAYDETLNVANRSWNELVGELNSRSIHTRCSSGQGKDVKCSLIVKEPFLQLPLSDKLSSPVEDTFLCRLLEVGATESCSAKDSPNQVENENQISRATTSNILQNIVTAIDVLWNSKDRIANTLVETHSQIEPSRLEAFDVLEKEVKNLRVSLDDLHIKHKAMASKVQSHRDTNAKNKAELKYLTGQLESTIAELEENTCKLTALKVQRDAAKGTSFPVLNSGSNHDSGDKAREKQNELQDMELELKNLLELASSRLIDIKSLHEERIGILKKLSNLQNTSKDLKNICSSKTFLLVVDQLEKSKAEVAKYQDVLEKLQVEKDNFAWREAEVSVKVDLADVFRRASAVADSQMADLVAEIQKQIDKRHLLEIKLEEASREPGRKEIITEFKALVSSFPKNMHIMQNQLSKCKEASSDVHSLRAEVRSLSTILDRKVSELKSVSGRSTGQLAEIQRLKAVLCDLNETDQELKLFLDMYRRESTDSRDVVEAKDLEYQAWAHVESLKTSLDEHSLESRVKEANEAEAITQQRLAAAEAEIADLRQKYEASGSDITKLSEVLKSKHEEGEAYLSEIESIGQAYEDIQSQNQQLLQQITERDDYNIKPPIVVQSLTVVARVVHNSSLFEDVEGVYRSIGVANTVVLIVVTTQIRIDFRLAVLAVAKCHCVACSGDSDEKTNHLELVLEGVRAKQVQDALRMDKQMVEKELQQTNASLGFYNQKGARIEDQMRMCSDQVGKLAEDKWRNSATSENTQKRLLDVRRECVQLRNKLEDSQSKAQRSRLGVAVAQIELEKERFSKKRMEEDLELAKRKAAHLSARLEGSSILEKLQQEVTEYREILKCSICHERPKEVVVTKCYHLFCNPCVQKILESRHRKCAVCSASFGPNDVKSVYI